jgi:hypothetical protein
MFEYALLLLVLLQIKHWYIDFVNQSMEEVEHKGIYWDWLGMKHSVKQGLGTVACLLLITGWEYLPFCLILGTLDAILHYNIDWAKMNWGNRDIQTPAFWAHLGLDQMLHQLTYIGIAWAMM